MILPEIKPLSKRKEEILTQAQILFSEAGYRSASMRNLADRLQIKAASLYSNFDNKEEMLWEIALRCAKSFFDKIDPICQLSLPADQKLKALLEAHIEVIIENRDASAIFFEQWKYLGDAKRDQYAAIQHTYEQKFVDVLREGEANGLFKSMNSRFVSLSLLSASNWISRWYKPEGKMAVEDIKDELIQVLMNGVCVRK
jgi:AcrR family transcriptional regulator